MENNLLDNELQEIEVPRKFAGFWIRVGASLIDLVVYLPLIGLNMYNLYVWKIIPLYFLLFLLLIIYKPFMEFKYGATLGKMAVNIKVVNQDFGKITLAQAIIRYIPWILNQAVEIISAVILFQHPDFYSISSMVEFGNLQNELISPAYSFITSMFSLISCIIVGLTSHKQGLHDLMANTYCIYKI